MVLHLDAAPLGDATGPNYPVIGIGDRPRTNDVPALRLRVLAACATS